MKNILMVLLKVLLMELTLWHFFFVLLHSDSKSSNNLDLLVYRSYPVHKLLFVQLFHLIVFSLGGLILGLPWGLFFLPGWLICLVFLVVFYYFYSLKKVSPFLSISIVCLGILVTYIHKLILYIDFFLS